MGRKHHSSSRKFILSQKFITIQYFRNKNLLLPYNRLIFQTPINIENLESTKSKIPYIPQSFLAAAMSASGIFL